MNWAVILTALACALGSAYLVFFKDWTAEIAFAVVGGGGLLVTTLLLAVICLLVKPQERPEILRQVRQTMKQDFDDVKRWLGFKR